SGKGRWPIRVGDILGDGLDLGEIAVKGPLLLHDGKPIFSMPAHLLGVIEDSAKGWRPRASLRPGPALCCDMGPAVRLPHLPVRTWDDGLRAGDGLWLTAAGLDEVLAGGLPEPSQMMPSTQLWHEEQRVGLERVHATRTAKEGML